MKPSEAAELFGVDPKTVNRWAAAGKLTVGKTLGGHRRYLRADVLRLREQMMGGHGTLA